MADYIKMALEYGPEALEAYLAILGGLKIFARYTKSKADDKIIEYCEKPARVIISLLAKMKDSKKDGKK